MVPFAAACGADPVAHDDALGTLQLAIAAGESHDVASFSFSIVEDGGTCAAGPVVASATIPLEDESLPPNLGGGDAHAFADALFVLPPGPYLACAAPLQSDASPSAACAPASAPVMVTEATTTEVVLIAQCDGEENGAVDVVAALNDPPLIDDLDIAPSKFILTCEQADITVSASDVNGDDLAYAWSVTNAPMGSSPSLVPAGADATFSTDTVGDYELTVDVTDAHGAATSLSFPIHVSPGNCDWLEVAASGASGDTTAQVGVDGTSHVIAAGHSDSSSWTVGSSSFNTAGGRDIWVAKWTPDGQATVWQAQFGTAGQESVRSMAVDASGDIFIAGEYDTAGLTLTGCAPLPATVSQDVFVAKLSGTTGACLWAHGSGGGGTERAYGLAVDASGHVVVAGRMQGSMTIAGFGTVSGGGSDDMFYAKFDGSTGANLWARGAGGGGDDVANAIAAIPGGDFAIVGGHTGGITFPGGVSIVHDGASGQDAFVLRIAGATGDAVWARSSTSTANEWANAVAVDPSGDILFAGLTYGTVDWGVPITLDPGTVNELYVVKLAGASGAHLWTAEASNVSGSPSFINGIATDASGHVRVAGYINGTIDWGTPLSVSGTRSAFHVTLASGSGVELSALASTGDLDVEPIAGVRVDPNDGTSVTGGFFNSTSMSFGGATGSLSAAGGYDAYVARLLP